MPKPSEKNRNGQESGKIEERKIRSDRSHKSVAFDVFEEVDGRYSVRALGMGMAFVILSALWTAGTVSMLRQDPEVTVARLIEDHRRMRADGKLGSLRMLRMLAEYLQPGFHPDRLDDYELARAHLRDMGRLDG